MRYAQIREMDIVNGKGIAISLFVQGCPHRCVGCFNPETWDFKGGKKWTPEVENSFIALCNHPYVDCISILGGEPLAQSDILPLLKRLSTIGKPIYMWTGYRMEDLNDYQRECIKYVDYLIDGRFEQDKRDLTLKLRGSSNQRIWDIKKRRIISDNK